MPNFPYKLHSLLERVEKEEELQSIISWLPDGKTFKIHSQEEFEKRLLREYFPRQTQIKSFMRQLQYYDFENFGQGIFRHPCFVRGQRNLCGQIIHQLPTKNQKQKGKSTRPLKTRGRKKKSRPLAINDDKTEVTTTSTTTSNVASARASSPQTSLGSDDGSVSSEESLHSANDADDDSYDDAKPTTNTTIATEPSPATPQRQASLPSSPASSLGRAMIQSPGRAGMNFLQQPSIQQLQQLSSSPLSGIHRPIFSTIPSSQQEQSLAQQLIAQQHHNHHQQQLLAAQNNVRANYLSGLQEELLLGSMLHNQRYLALLQQQQQRLSSASASVRIPIARNEASSRSPIASPNDNFLDFRALPTSRFLLPTTTTTTTQQQHDNNASFDMGRLQADVISNHLRNVAALNNHKSKQDDDDDEKNKKSNVGSPKKGNSEQQHK